MIIRYRLNGENIEQDVQPNETLLDVLRDKVRLTSVKKGCDEGACGTCTILLNGKAVRACLLLAVQASGNDVITLENIARDGKLDEIQEAFVEKYGFQCGYCTPGMIMSCYALLLVNPDPTRDEVRRAISGNLCRCTGYQPIIDAVMAVCSSGNDHGEERTFE